MAVAYLMARAHLKALVHLMPRPRLKAMNYLLPRIHLVSNVLTADLFTFLKDGEIWEVAWRLEADWCLLVG